MNSTFNNHSGNDIIIDSKCQKYEIYKGKACINENPTKCLGCITNKIKLIGRSVSKDFGSHKKVAKE